jgi:predicted nucleotidyltransferase
METREEILDFIVRTIVARFHPHRIILFGSQAREDGDRHSDYDVLVEMDSDTDLATRSADVSLALSPRHFSLDVVAYTPQEVAARRGRVGTLVSIAESEGKVLYERT